MARVGFRDKMAGDTGHARSRNTVWVFREIKDRKRSVEEILRMVVKMNWSKERPENFKKKSIIFLLPAEPDK